MNLHATGRTPAVRRMEPAPRCGDRNKKIGEHDVIEGTLNGALRLVRTIDHKTLTVKTVGFHQAKAKRERASPGRAELGTPLRTGNGRKDKEPDGGNKESR